MRDDGTTESTMAQFSAERHGKIQVGNGPVGDMRHFLRGRTGANSVLNKDKIFGSISVHTQHHRCILFYPLHWEVATFPSSRSLLSSPIVFYKSDIINQTLAEPHSHPSKGQIQKVAGQILLVWWSGGLRAKETQSYVSHSLVVKGTSRF